ncbi:MHS family MFS transporter [Plantibacter sp. MCCC 1A11337]|uniref:MFS transporter n=1 Tax=Plantibacter sp. MCCC 1A11337 TaxID=2736644 RepID=UPI000EADF02D|nr:MFS transporter [Plantibacter sp. MCCC 1A11337]NUJ87699.1 MHS family MFS transporter [Plantibacter sp. MCCC 1A11337]
MAHPTPAPAPVKDNPIKVSTASMIGTAVESYDFFIYGTAAAAYFGTAFFHAENAFVGVLASFATLAIGFLFRPLGGYLAGHFGDRIGRKTILIWALSIMGVATFLIGLLPTYGTVGVLAPILLILLRAIQGIGYGAEWGGAVLMAVEHAPLKRRGFFGAVPQIGIPAGLLLANGSFLLSAALFEGDWVWRVPFLFSIVMVAIGLWIRLGIHESPDFEQMKAAGEIHKRPAIQVIKQDWRIILRIMGLRLAETGGYYITTSFALSYVVLAGISDKQYVLYGTLVGSALGLGTHLAYGALSDRIGRRNVFLIGSIFTILFGVPMFLLINTGAIIMIIVAVTLSLILSHDPIFAVEGSWFSEQFDRNVRSSGISLGYNGASVVAGLLPFIATALYGWIGWVGPAVLLSALGVVSTLCALTARETAPIKTGQLTAADTSPAELVRR